ncbi:MAG: FtsX-like permease family protein, partial [Perlabentimonas sp.]
YIINETAARMLGLENPIGAQVVMWRRPGVIIGVVKDYHFTSLKTNIEPLIISRYNSRIYNLTIRIREEDKEETISQIIDIIKKHEPNYIPSHFYLDDFLAKQYGAERRTYKLILSASILALILSMVGLYALSAYSLARRTKELGVRKILGASVKSLYELLIIDSTKWVLIANVIALPVGWYFAKEWLNDFAYRINIEPLIFIAAALSAYTIALLTVLWQIVKAARANPAEALRYE